MPAQPAPPAEPAGAGDRSGAQVRSLASGGTPLFRRVPAGEADILHQQRQGDGEDKDRADEQNTCAKNDVHRGGSLPM